MAEVKAESKEAVALELLLIVARVEGKWNGGVSSLESGPWTGTTKQWVLQTYHDCLRVTRGYKPN